MNKAISLLFLLNLLVSSLNPTIPLLKLTIFVSSQSLFRVFVLGKRVSAFILYS